MKIKSTRSRRDSRSETLPGPVSADPGAPAERERAGDEAPNIHLESPGGTHYPGSAEERRALAAFIKLLRAAHWISAKAGKRREEAGFTENQFGVLEALHHLGPCDQMELTRKLLTSPSNLTLVIDNLEKAGYVERFTGIRDRRRRVVHLTARARAVMQALMPVHVGRIVEVMSALSAREQEQLGGLCRKLGHRARELD